MVLKNKNKKLIKSRDDWLLDYIQKYPIIDDTKISRNLNVDYFKVNRTIQKFVKLGILSISNASKLKRKYVYSEYLKNLKRLKINTFKYQKVNFQV